MAPPRGVPKTPGSGRKKGSRNKRTRELEQRVATTGKTPMEVMLDRMREADDRCKYLETKIKRSRPIEDAELVEALVKQLDKAQSFALECAAAAANYVHPKLASIDQRITNPDGSIVAPVINNYGLSGRRIDAPDDG